MSSLMLSGAVSVNGGVATGRARTRKKEKGTQPVPDPNTLVRDQEEKVSCGRKLKGLV